MPIIRPSSDLRNNYNEISTICHKTKKPVYITKNGAGDLAVMSIEHYDNTIAKIELYSKLAEGLKDIQEGRIQPFEEAMSHIKQELGI